jgi:hypothetical protein
LFFRTFWYPVSPVQELQKDIDAGTIRTVIRLRRSAFSGPVRTETIDTGMPTAGFVSSMPILRMIVSLFASLVFDF